MSASLLTVGIVAGEASGDNLGAPLMAAIRQRRPNVRFIGVGGPSMRQEGIQALAGIESLSVNGLVQPLLRLPSLVALMRKLVRDLQVADAVVGVDFNVFNLMLERRLKRKGIPTAHYVSPAVYAWRRGRIKRIGASTDVVMTLFPFEPEIYLASSVHAEFVGHPMAQAISAPADREAARSAAREELGLDPDSVTIALMPGSRDAELKNMGGLFFAAAEELCRLMPSEPVQFVVPCLHETAATRLMNMSSAHPGFSVHIAMREAVTALQASDVALVKAGTGTLEALLARTPMVVTYRADPLSFALISRMLHTDSVALPNILAKRKLVPELWQDVANPQNLAEALRDELQRSRSDPSYFQEHDRIHESLCGGGPDRAAEVVLSLLPE